MMAHALAGKYYRLPFGQCLNDTVPVRNIPGLKPAMGPTDLINRLYELARSSAAFRYAEPSPHDHLTGNVADSLPFYYNRKDSAGMTRYQLSGYFRVIGDSVTLSLRDSLVLNYKAWVLSPANQLHFSQ